MGEKKMMDDQGSRLSALRDRVIRGEYEIDPRAVAEAIVRYEQKRTVRFAPLEGVLVAGEVGLRVGEERPWRAI